MTMADELPVLPEGMPLPSPRPDGVDLPYWEAARAERLAVQRCSACGRRQFPPEAWCRHCTGAELEWVDVAPTATLYTWARAWHPVHPVLAEAGPYVLAVVEVVPGEVRMLGDLVAPPEGDLPIGAPVEAVFEHHDDVTLVQWRLLEPG